MKTEITTTGSSHGLGIIGVITVIFVTLKLLGLLDWSWWWVFSPIWITVIGVIGLLILGALILGCVALFVPIFVRIWNLLRGR